MSDLSVIPFVMLVLFTTTLGEKLSLNVFTTLEKVYTNGLPRSMVTLLNVSLILLKTVLMFRNIKT